MCDVPGVAHAAERRSRMTARDQRFGVAPGLLCGEPLGDQRREHQPGDDGVDAHLVRRVMHRADAREMLQPGFCRGVGGELVAEVAQPGDRGNVDDRPAALRDHVRRDHAGRQVHVVQVVMELFVPGVRRNLLRAAGDAAADVVHQDVDAAEGRQSFVDHLLQGLFVGHVGGERAHAAALLGDQCRGLAGRGLAHVDAGKARALAREHQADRAAVAHAGALANRASAEHQRHLVLQPIAHRGASLRRAPGSPR